MNKKLDTISNRTVSLPYEIRVNKDGRKEFYVDVGALNSDDAKKHIDDIKKSFNDDDFFIPKNECKNAESIIQEGMKLANDINKAFKNKSKYPIEENIYHLEADFNTLVKQFGLGISSSKEDTSISDIWSEEEQNQFQKNWNNSKLSRTKLTREILDTLLSELLAFKPDIPISVTSPVEANTYLLNHSQFTNSKTSIEMVLRRLDGDVLYHIEENDDPLNFKKYYDWCAKVEKNLHSHNYKENPLLSNLVSKLLNEYRYYMDDIEKKMLDIMIDTETSNNYTSEWYSTDLKKAYEYAIKKGIDA